MLINLLVIAFVSQAAVGLEAGPPSALENVQKSMNSVKGQKIFTVPIPISNQLPCDINQQQQFLPQQQQFYNQQLQQPYQYQQYPFQQQQYLPQLPQPQQYLSQPQLPYYQQQPQQFDNVLITGNNAVVQLQPYQQQQLLQQQLPPGYPIEWVFLATPEQFQQMYPWSNNGACPQQEYVIVENNNQMIQVPQQICQQWQQAPFLGLTRILGNLAVTGLKREMAYELKRRNHIIKGRNRNFDSVPGLEQVVQIPSSLPTALPSAVPKAPRKVAYSKK